MEMTKTKEFTLSKKTDKVRVEFIKRVDDGKNLKKGHVLYGGMMEGSKRALCALKSKHTFKYVRVLTDEEQAYLEKVMGMEKQGLNVYKSTDNYWDSITINLTKEGITLDRSDPVEYIKYKILLAYTDLIAPSLEEQKIQNKLTYQFVIIHPGEEDTIKVDKYQIKKEAYAIAAKLELNIEKIKEFLYLCGIRVPANSSQKWIKGKLGYLVEEEAAKVVDIYSAEHYTVRSLIAKGVLSGVIIDKGGRYYLEGGVSLAADEETPSLANAVKFLSDDNNADIKIKIEAKLG